MSSQRKINTPSLREERPSDRINQLRAGQKYVLYNQSLQLMLTERLLALLLKTRPPQSRALHPVWLPEWSEQLQAERLHIQVQRIPGRQIHHRWWWRIWTSFIRGDNHTLTGAGGRLSHCLDQQVNHLEPGPGFHTSPSDGSRLWH